MFCYQCEQTAGGSGCTKIGVCGKNEDIQSLQDILLFGLKGIAAYAYHARELGAKSEEVDAFMHEALFKTVTNVSFDLNQYIALVLKCGSMNLRVMELLDKAHTARFGNPQPIAVDTGTRKGPGILITGHDLIAMGFRPGPLFSEILKAVEDAQLDGEILDGDEARKLVMTRWGIGKEERG